MQSRSVPIITFFLVHIGLGLLLYLFPGVAKLITIAIFVFGLYWIIQNEDRDAQTLYAAAYVAGAEVLLRMFGATFFNEFGKYSIMIFAAVGIAYRGLQPLSFLFFFFLLLLIPGIFIGIKNLALDANVRKAIAFNISGPACLGVFAMYTAGRMVTLEQVKKSLFFLGLPILSTLVILFLRVPSVKEVVTGTDSNFATSGGYGPNQMATILGLGMFLFFTMFLIDQRSKKLTYIYLILSVMLGYRCLVTFSRGGMITGLVMMVVLVGVLYWKLNPIGKAKITSIAAVILLLGVGVWTYSTIQTSGLIEKRYANQDAAGRLKQDKLGGREKVNKAEIQMFLDNPITGVGVGVNKQYREEMTGIEAASHNELTRMLAEHGLAGLLGLLILFLVPFFTSFANKQHIFLWSFFFFWLLTINHAAMRLAAPAFVYALSLLKVVVPVKRE
ncbi:MAG: O-antigen ligase family protein [Flavobacteriales bacterium]|nr:O-antigen ligase family protein [Flavobacteriales bacterium]